VVNCCFPGEGGFPRRLATVGCPWFPYRSGPISVAGFVSDNSPGVKNTLLTVLSGKPTVCDMMARQRTLRIPVVLGG
jgi:hypothetical protein